MEKTTQIRKALIDEGYKIKRRQLSDSQIINRGGYVAGTIDRQKENVFLDYAPHADPHHLQAVMELYDVCQEHKLPYSVSGIPLAFLKWWHRI